MHCWWSCREHWFFQLISLLFPCEHCVVAHTQYHGAHFRKRPFAAREDRRSPGSFYSLWKGSALSEVQGFSWVVTLRIEDRSWKLPPQGPKWKIWLPGFPRSLFATNLRHFRLVCDAWATARQSVYKVIYTFEQMLSRFSCGTGPTTTRARLKYVDVGIYKLKDLRSPTLIVKPAHNSFSGISLARVFEKPNSSLNNEYIGS